MMDAKELEEFNNLVSLAVAAIMKDHPDMPKGIARKLVFSTIRQLLKQQGINKWT